MFAIFSEPHCYAGSHTWVPAGVYFRTNNFHKNEGCHNDYQPQTSKWFSFLSTTQGTGSFTRISNDSASWFKQFGWIPRLTADSPESITPLGRPESGAATILKDAIWTESLACSVPWTFGRGNLFTHNDHKRLLRYDETSNIGSVERSELIGFKGKEVFELLG